MVTKTLLSLILSVVLVLPAAARVETQGPPRGDGPQLMSTGTPQEPSDSSRNTGKQIQDAIKENREAFKTSLEQRQEEFKNALEAKRKEVKEKIEVKRIELKERLAKIKDERKKKIVERISNQLNELNERMLNHFSNVLEKLDAVLLKISSRADKAESRGLNVQAVRGAISEAKSAIAVSRAAISTQSAKVYSITVNTEDTLKVDVGKTRQALHDDLAKVRETVKMAKEAIRKVLVVLAQIPRVDEEPVPTSTE